MVCRYHADFRRIGEQLMLRAFWLDSVCREPDIALLGGHKFRDRRGLSCGNHCSNPGPVRIERSNRRYQ